MVSGTARALLLLAAGALLVIAACGSAALPTVERAAPVDFPDPRVPVAERSTAGGLTGRELLERSDAEMRLVRAVTVEFRSGSSESRAESVRTVSPFTASERPLQYAGPFATIIAVSDRSSGGFAQLRQGAAAAGGLRVTAARDARIIGQAVIDGRETWVIWYRFTAPSAESPFEVWRTEWIDQADLRLLVQVSDSFDHLAGRPRTTLTLRY